jgi:formate/nitrite transporter
VNEKPSDGGSEPEPAHDQHGIDTTLPDAMAMRAEAIGVQKARLDLWSLFVLAVLAGAFIGFGGMFATIVSAGANEALPFGVTRLLAGLVFSLGLILVIVGGAELFTGNALIVLAWAGRKVSTFALLRNWTLVFAGNLVGAMATAGLVYASGQYQFGDGAVGIAALTQANAKCALGFGQALALGTLCNVLVCLACWLCYGARSTTDRVVAIVLPIAAFVAGGFEHSVANLYAIPIGLMIQAWAPAEFWQAIGRTAADYPALSWAHFGHNILPVVIGNMIGGGVLVGGVYWLVYLRKR